MTHMHMPSKKLAAGAVAAVLAVVVFFALTQQPQSVGPEPVGPGQVGPKPIEPVPTVPDPKGETFSSEQNLVTTYFFYWYPMPDMGPRRDEPPAGKPFGYDSVEWFRRELSDMEEAGIDFVLVTWWGKHGEWGSWPFVGLQNLSKARDELLEEGRSPPKIAFFFDAIYNTYPNGPYKDMETEEGKEFFYSHINDFFSHLPKRHWARIDGKPIAWFFSSRFGMNATQEGFDYFKGRFEADFNEKPFVVLSRNCRGSQGCEFEGISSDLDFEFEAASSGPKFNSVIQLGSGYDDFILHIPRPIRLREQGYYYEKSWRSAIEHALENKTRIIAVESWNELFEGSSICETERFGRDYIDLTKKYSGYFHEGAIPPEPTPALASADSVSAALGKNPEFDGLAVPYQTGLVFAEHSGKECISAKPNPEGTRAGLGAEILDYLSDPLQVNVADSFSLNQTADFFLEIEFFADTDKRFFIYAPKPSIGGGAMVQVAEARAEASGNWQTISIPLKGVSFNGKAAETDFTIRAEKTELCISSLRLSRA